MRCPQAASQGAAPASASTFLLPLHNPAKMPPSAQTVSLCCSLQSMRLKHPSLSWEMSMSTACCLELTPHCYHDSPTPPRKEGSKEITMVEQTNMATL